LENKMTGRYALAAILALSACYTYQPLASPEPAAGDRVSAQLTSEGSRELADQIGPEVLHVEGDVLEVDSTGLNLEVHEIESYRGIRSGWGGERLHLPRQAVAGMQQRKLSVGGTGFLAGVLTIGLYAVYRVLGGPGLFEGGNGNPGGPGR
jgi:hypothetical protein